MVASLAAITYFMPILSFLLVFILVFALLAKTQILGDNKFVHLFISFILAVFFIVQVSLVDFVTFSSAWFAVFFVIVFLILVMTAFVKGDLETFTQNKYIAWVLLGLIIVFFIISSAYTFNWAVNWDKAIGWAYSDWFGLVLLLIIAGIVSVVLAKAKS